MYTKDTAMAASSAPLSTSLATDTEEINEFNDVVFPKTSQAMLALADLKAGLVHWRIWVMLASQDIKLRYRRSVLGPFWITLSMAITVYSMGFLYSHLFHMPLGEYFPYLVAGMLGWSLISTIVTEAVETFTSNDSLLKQIKLPYSLYIHRMSMRNLMIFIHNMLVFVPIALIFHHDVPLSWHLLLLVPGLLVLYFNSISYGLIFAMIGARYRDVSQLIKSLTQVVFFITPVLWKPSILPSSKQFIAQFNPAYSMLELIRAPMMGYGMTRLDLLMVFFLTLFGTVVSFYMFASRRARIIYWL